MPAPAVYVVAAIGAVAAGLAFKQFVYEPHLAPKLEQWAEEFLANRRARRQAREGYGPIPVPTHSDDDDDEHDRPPSQSRTRQSTSSGGYESNSRERNGGYTNSVDAFELETLRQWRSEVDNLQQARLRHRNNAGRTGSGNEAVPTVPRSPPTHVLFDPSVPSTPSTSTSYRPSPVARSSALEVIEEAPRPEVGSTQTLVPSGRLPTPDPSVTTSPNPSAVPLSPNRVPSLSEAYPVELDSERGIELLSGPSSRAETPFSSFSNPVGRGQEEVNQAGFTIFNFSSPTTRSPELEEVASPASQRLSELDFLSDFEEHNVRSPQSVITDATWDDDDAHSAGGSDLSWESARARGQ